MEGNREARPAGVPQQAKQAGEIRDRWSWVEPCVWTDRMLAALENNGVRGGKWFSMTDKVYAPVNLRRAFEKVKANRGAAGVDHQTVGMFEKRLEANLERLATELQDGTYRPKPIRRVMIPKPGSREGRPLGIPTVRDRVVQGAARHVMEPIWERDFAEHSYGFRPGRGCKDALRRVAQLLEAGHVHVVDADLKGYFDSIPHERLMEAVGRKISDGQMLSLVEGFLKQSVMTTMESWQPAAGTPQGAVLSPLLSNIYLDPLDHLMAGKGMEMVRYADDFVVLCRSQKEAEEALTWIKQWVHDAGLTLHPDKTRISDARTGEGFEFLGYHFKRGRRWPRRKSLKKLKETLKPKTRRTNGQSLADIISNVNRTLRGWFEYFKHSHRTAFPEVDGWVRMRLRCILRKRSGRKGRGHIADNIRWPNTFFAEQGLFVMSTAHAAAGRSV